MEAAFPVVSGRFVGVSRLRCAPQEYSFPSVTALRSTRPWGGRGRQTSQKKARPTKHSIPPTDQHVVSTEGPCGPTWRDLHRPSTPERIQQAHGGVSTPLSLRSTRPWGGRGRRVPKKKPSPYETNVASTPLRPSAPPSYRSASSSVAGSATSNVIVGCVDGAVTAFSTSNRSVSASRRAPGFTRRRVVSCGASRTMSERV